MTDTATRIRRILSDQFGDAAYPDSANLILNIGADSLDTVELAMQIEEAFGIELPHDALDTVATVGDLITMVDGMQAPAQIAGLS